MSERRIIAKFVPQAWIHDNAVAIDGEVEFDVTDKILAMPKQKALELLDDREETDQLARDAGLLENHTGPFYVEVEMAIAEYFDESTDTSNRTGVQACA